MYKSAEVTKLLGQQLRLLQKQKDKLETQILYILENDPLLNEKCEKICRLKGPGRISMAVIIAETNAFTLFENISQLVSYVGYDVPSSIADFHSGEAEDIAKLNSTGSLV